MPKFRVYYTVPYVLEVEAVNEQSPTIPTRLLKGNPMFIVTSEPITEIIADNPKIAFFAYKSDAEIYAKRLAALTNEAQKIYIVEEESKFLPPEEPSWEVMFSQVNSETVTVKAKDLHQAIQKARESFPAGEWDLIRSTLLTEEQKL